MAVPIRYYLPLEEIEKIKENIIKRYAGQPLTDEVNEMIQHDVSIMVEQLFKKLGYVK